MKIKKMDVNFWNAVFQWGSVALIAVTFVFGAGALWTSNRINDRQTARIHTLESDVATATTRQTEAETRLHSVEGETARQQERAANAERLLEQERAARVKLDLRTANRSLEPAVFQSLSSEMATFAGQPAEVVVFPVNFESVYIADLIHGILGNAKWSVGLFAKRLIEAPELPTEVGPMARVMVQGVLIRSSGDSASIAAARALVDALGDTVAAATYDKTRLPGPPRVFVLIGDKPTPLSVWVNRVNK